MAKKWLRVAETP
ncbi:hypothetical protein MTR67_039520 [Solanum verrucosum]|nr:hypothetical protein MTR67_039520 [Solanum verrucosum]